MQIGFVGLGKMGGNMVRRIRRDSDHEVVGLNLDKAVTDALASETGMIPTRVAARTWSTKLDTPRHIWLMIPSGAPTQQTIMQLYGLLDEGDLIIDGGNSKWSDSKANGEEAARRGFEFVDVGTSGGVWGLQEGYCMMVGGDRRGGRPGRADPRHPRAAERLGADGRPRRGPLREDGPQRRRVRPDAGLRRGLRDHARLRLRPQPGADREALARGLGRAFVAARPARPTRSSRRATTSSTSRATCRTRARAAGRCSSRSTSPCPRR